MRAHVYVTGYVQGVFFRHSMAKRARDLGVSGWVRNLDDGRVEAVVEGEESDVGAVVDWCRSGPPHATVEHVEVSWEPATREFSVFSTI
ncbi:MAG: acylphosphatase [Actinomycetota bacterium]